MKNQALFPSKDKNKKLKCCLLQFLFGALRVTEFLCTCGLFMLGIIITDCKKSRLLQF